MMSSRGLKLRLGARPTGGVAHDGEKEEEFQGVDQQKNDEKDVEASQRQRGKPAKESVGGQGDAEHFGRESESGPQLAVAGMKKGENEGDGDGTDGDHQQ